MKKPMIGLGINLVWLGVGAVAGSFFIKNGFFFGVLILCIGIILMILSNFWQNIASILPLNWIKEDANPDKYLDFRIFNIDNDALLMLNNAMPIGHIYIDMMVKSELHFDINFNALRGYIIVNGEDMRPQAELQDLHDVIITKQGTTKIKWLLDIKDTLIKDRFIDLKSPDENNKVKIGIIGIDNKDRWYRKISKEWIQNDTAKTWTEFVRQDK